MKGNFKIIEPGYNRMATTPRLSVFASDKANVVVNAGSRKVMKDWDYCVIGIDIENHLICIAKSRRDRPGSIELTPRLYSHGHLVHSGVVKLLRHATGLTGLMIPGAVNDDGDLIFDYTKAVSNQKKDTYDKG